ncbi:Ig-like domain-containing protein [Candidatus Palauibacter sp.]|uniref:Ig-like domain-containing protein n=1 Tax=Candidatus Palauibacter sp. TaxID=3101350 RepID=UPI003B5228F5
MTRFRDVRGRLALAALVLAAACGEGATEPVPGPPPPPPNRAPAAVGSVPAAALVVGDSATLDVLPFFRDPDGDALRYAASSSNAEMASVSIAGSEVTVAGVSRGTATVTVTAVDPDGQAAQQIFAVTVTNQAPVARAALPALQLAPGDSASLNLASHFRDPDGHDLTFEAGTSDAEVVAAAVAGDILTVAAVARGTAVVTVTARDPNGLSARQTLVVTVPNRAPAPVDSIPALELRAGNSMGVDVTRYFTDPDGDTLTYSPATSNAGVAMVSQGRVYLTVAAVRKGTATITLTATDTYGLAAQQVFTVTVPNRPPVATDPIPDVLLTTMNAAVIDLSLHFTDFDGDRLAYTAEAEDPTIASVVAHGSRLEISPLRRARRGRAPSP